LPALLFGNLSTSFYLEMAEEDRTLAETTFDAQREIVS